jgi:hypothetical protein
MIWLSEEQLKTLTRKRSQARNLEEMKRLDKEIEKIKAEIAQAHAKKTEQKKGDNK